MAYGTTQQPNGFPWNGIIIPWSAALRSKPTTRSTVLSDLPRGENVKVLLRAKGYLYVESKSKLKGFVSSELIAPVPSPDTARTGAKVAGTPPPAGILPASGQKPLAPPPGSFQLDRPRVIAIATDTYLKPMVKVTDDRIPGGYTLDFGQDLSFAKGRAMPSGSPSVGATIPELERKMRELLPIFASGDTRGKARQLFNDFLRPNKTVAFWSNASLTAAAQGHPNITTFIHRALSAPNSPERTTGQIRIHQALEKAGWNINVAVTAKGLGVPAFNQGSPGRSTEDYNNGLGLMINGIQHALVVARDYHYDPQKGEYTIRLEYVFYDVFGLDDDDLSEYGANGGIDFPSSQGITAWWQLQHQYGYVPFITRMAFEQEFTVPVPPVSSSRSARP